MNTGRIPIAAARSLGQKYDCPVIVVFALHPPGDNRFTVTTYGQTKKLCRLAAEYGERIARGIELGEIQPSATEPDGGPEQPMEWQGPAPADGGAR